MNELLQNKGGKGVFLKVSDDTTWVSFDAGKQHAAAIRNDGSLWALGKNNMGQLGNGRTTMVNAPVLIGNDSNWQSVSAGGNYTIAIKRDGSIWYCGATGFMKEQAKSSNVPTLFDASIKHKSIAAGPNRLLLTLAICKEP